MKIKGLEEERGEMEKVVDIYSKYAHLLLRQVAKG